MFARVSEFLGLKAGKTSPKDELALATAALLVQVSKADGDFSAGERAALLKALTERYGLDAWSASEILTRAETREAEATSLYEFTRTLARELDQDERQEIVRLLWQVALADDSLDNFEANALAKIAGLLGVTPEDRVRIKHEVMGR